MKISVIVPSYNQARYLPATLDSLAGQNYPDLEVRIYDGGSTDGSVEILRNHPAQFWWVSKRDDGQAAAINRGLGEASGDILAFLNSDDIYYPRTLEAVAEYFERNPGCLVLYGDADHLNADGSIMEPYYTEPWNYDRLQEVCFLCQPAVFWRREIIERFGLLDDRLHFALDYEYWLRIGKHAPFHHLKGRVLAGSRLHADTKTLSQRTKAHREILSVVIRHGGSKGAVLGWLQHLSHYEAGELAAPNSSLPEESHFFAPLFVASVLRNAHDQNLRLDSAMLRELEGRLNSAGFKADPPCA
jgi:glycosyltransferase involved in cell wall biosynthesis